MTVTTAPDQASVLLSRLFRAWARAADPCQTARLERMMAAAFDLAGSAYSYTTR